MAEMEPLVSTSKSWNESPHEPDNIYHDQLDQASISKEENKENTKFNYHNNNSIKRSPPSQSPKTYKRNKNIYGKIKIDFSAPSPINYSFTPSFLLFTSPFKSDRKAFGNTPNERKSVSIGKDYKNHPETPYQEEICSGMSSSGRPSSGSSTDEEEYNEEEQTFEEELNEVLQGIEEPDEADEKQKNLLLSDFIKVQRGSNKSSDSICSNKAVRGTPMGSSWPFEEPTEIVGDLTEGSIDITASQCADCPSSNLVPPMISPCASKVYDFTIQEENQNENCIKIDDKDDKDDQNQKEGSEFNIEYCEYDFNHDDIDRLSVVGDAPASSGKKRHYSFVRAIKEITENIDYNQSETDELNKAFRTLPSLIIPTNLTPTGLTPRSSPHASPFSMRSPKKSPSKRRSLQEFSLNDLPDYFAPEERLSTLGGHSFSIGRHIPRKLNGRTIHNNI